MTVITAFKPGVQRNHLAMAFLLLSVVFPGASALEVVSNVAQESETEVPVECGEEMVLVTSESKIRRSRRATAVRASYSKSWKSAHSGFAVGHILQGHRILHDLLAPLQC